MKKFSVLGLACMSLLASSSCTRELIEISTEQAVETSSQVSLDRPRLVPLRALPPRPSNSLRVLPSDAPDLTLARYTGLGGMYKVEDETIGHPQNLSGYVVLDVARMLKDPVARRYMYYNEIGQTKCDKKVDTDFKSFYLYDRAERTFDAGFSLNLGFFKLGKESTYRKVFSTTSLDSTSYTFGSVDLMYCGSRLGLTPGDLTYKTIATRSLDASFLYMLYNESMRRFLDDAGKFVVCRYLMGGRLSAMYEHKQMGHLREHTRGEMLNSSINASFHWTTTTEKGPRNDSLGVSVGFIRGDSISERLRRERGMVRCRLDVIGGGVAHGIPSVPIDLSTSMVSLNGWYSSLADERSHRMIDVEDKGLVSLDRFILEDNFRTRFLRVAQNEYLRNHQVAEPWLEFQTMEISTAAIDDSTFYRQPDYGHEGMVADDPMLSNPMSVPCAVLYTRHGDVVRFVNDTWVRNAKKQQVEGEERYMFYNAYRSYFGCKIKYREERKYALQTFSGVRINDGVIEIQFPFDFSRAKRYRNERTGVGYIYDPVAKTALSYFDSIEDDLDDDYILDTYGLTDLVNRLPEQKINIMTLVNQYKIVGL